MNFGTNIQGELYALELRKALFNKIVYFFSLALARQACCLIGLCSSTSNTWARTTVWQGWQEKSNKLLPIRLIISASDFDGWATKVSRLFKISEFSNQTSLFTSSPLSGVHGEERHQRCSPGQAQPNGFLGNTISCVDSMWQNLYFLCLCRVWIT